jgi:hypothetical protein
MRMVSDALLLSKCWQHDPPEGAPSPCVASPSTRSRQASTKHRANGSGKCGLSARDITHGNQAANPLRFGVDGVLRVIDGQHIRGRQQQIRSDHRRLTVSLARYFDAATMMAAHKRCPPAEADMRLDISRLGAFPLATARRLHEPDAPASNKQVRICMFVCFACPKCIQDMAAEMPRSTADEQTRGAVSWAQYDMPMCA